MSSIKIRLKQFEGTTLVRTLITHPMETGRRINKKDNKLIPADYIVMLVVEHNGQNIARCKLGPGISKNPYFSFRFKNGVTGDLVKVKWLDNKGRSDSAQTTIP